MCFACFSDCRLLWEFLHDLLKDKETSLVRWHNEQELSFTIVDPASKYEGWGWIGREGRGVGREERDSDSRWEAEREKQRKMQRG